MIDDNLYYLLRQYSTMPVLLLDYSILLHSTQVSMESHQRIFFFYFYDLL